MSKKINYEIGIILVATAFVAVVLFALQSSEFTGHSVGVSRPPSPGGVPACDSSSPFCYSFVCSAPDCTRTDEGNLVTVCLSNKGYSCNSDRTQCQKKAECTIYDLNNPGITSTSIKLEGDTISCVGEQQCPDWGECKSCVLVDPSYCHGSSPVYVQTRGACTYTDPCGLGSPVSSGTPQGEVGPTGVTINYQECSNPTAPAPAPTPAPVVADPLMTLAPYGVAYDKCANTLTATSSLSQVQSCEDLANSLVAKNNELLTSYPTNRNLLAIKADFEGIKIPGLDYLEAMINKDLSEMILMAQKQIDGLKAIQSSYSDTDYFKGIYPQGTAALVSSEEAVKTQLQIEKNNQTKTTTTTVINNIVNNPVQNTVNAAGCVENWNPGIWGNCIDGVKTRSPTDLNNCGTTQFRPIDIIACTTGTPLPAAPIGQENFLSKIMSRVAAFFRGMWGILGASSSGECTTADCFISAANQCKEASLISADSESGAIFAYYANNCTFGKEVVLLDSGETQEMKDLLEGKTLVCTYNKTKFDSNWISTISIGIEDCSGDLRDTIYGLAVLALPTEDEGTTTTSATTTTATSTATATDTTTSTSPDYTLDVSMGEGETNTLALGGTAHTISVVSVSMSPKASVPSLVEFTLDGVSHTLQEGTSGVFSGVKVTIDVVNSADDVEFTLG